MSHHRDLQRVEAFSDGVFAIACTLLILEIKVPHLEDLPHTGSLGAGLRAQWPSFVAYLLSFSSIFVAWVGHHRALGMLVRVSKPFMYANGLLLLTITFIPFPTAVLAEYIDTDQANMAVAFFAGTSVITSFAFHLWFFTMRHPVRLFADAISPAMIRRARVQMWTGMGIYVATMIIAWWYPIVSLLLLGLCQVLWIILSLESHDGLDD